MPSRIQVSGRVCALLISTLVAAPRVHSRTGTSVSGGTAGACCPPGSLLHVHLRVFLAAGEAPAAVTHHNGRVYTFGSNMSRERRSTQFEQMPDHAHDLEELVLLPLLQSHQGPGRLLRVLGVGEDAPHSLLRLHVARLLEELHQRVLVDVLEDVGRGSLAVRRVELVSVDGRADPATFRRHVGRHAGSLFLRRLRRVSLLQVWPANSDDER